MTIIYICHLSLFSLRLHQECTYFTYLKFFQPLFGSQYHIRCSLKASHVSEGCLMMLRKEAFQVPPLLK